MPIRQLRRSHTSSIRDDNPLQHDRVEFCGHAARADGLTLAEGFLRRRQVERECVCLEASLDCYLRFELRYAARGATTDLAYGIPALNAPDTEEGSGWLWREPRLYAKGIIALTILRIVILCVPPSSSTRGFFAALAPSPAVDGIFCFALAFFVELLSPGGRQGRGLARAPPSRTAGIGPGASYIPGLGSGALHDAVFLRRGGPCP